MTQTQDAFTVVILAGGLGSRFKGDKRFALIEGQTLVARALRIARLASPLVILSVRPGESALFSSIAPCIEDAALGLGPLAGIVSGLRAASTRKVVFLPVDTPFVPPSLLRHLVKSDCCTVVDDGQGIHPLIACYPSVCLRDAEIALAHGELAVRKVVSRWRPLRIGVEVLATYGDPASILFNVNSQDDLELARYMANRLTHQMHD